MATAMEFTEREKAWIRERALMLQQAGLCNDSIFLTIREEIEIEFPERKARILEQWRRKQQEFIQKNGGVYLKIGPMKVSFTSKGSNPKLKKAARMLEALGGGWNASPLPSKQSA